MPSASSLRLLPFALLLASCSDPVIDEKGDFAVPRDASGPVDQSIDSALDLSAIPADLATTADGGDGGPAADLVMRDLVVLDLLPPRDLAQPPDIAGCAMTCPNGCCDINGCRASAFATCGTGGVACVACDPLTADACDAKGKCTCAGNAACAAGLHCVGGKCVCDAMTCKGCCDLNGNCKPGTLSAECGVNAAACKACAQGQVCGAGQCGNCNANSCPKGCCSNGSCLAPSVANCGTSGQACYPCDPLLANACSVNGCQCGANRACGAGQRCSNGQCVCDAMSCPAGCCTAQGQCVSPPTAMSCGTGGALCNACNPAAADTCVAGVCKCGGGAACGAGQKCSGGACVCDGTTCPNGCCDANNQCQMNKAAACGTGGAACVACDPNVADTCSAGVCKCGPLAACGAGKQCVGGVCACNAASCPNGCCDLQGTCQPGNANIACGTKGMLCAACQNGQQCVGGVCNGCGPATCPNGCCSNNTCIPFAQMSLTACGSGGAACKACGTTADGCIVGTCTCGGAAACAAGQVCFGTKCICTPQSCPNGCCDAMGQCKTSSIATCGTNGAACVACPNGKQCVNGACM